MDKSLACRQGSVQYLLEIVLVLIWKAWPEGILTIALVFLAACIKIVVLNSLAASIVAVW